ncbi:hypothetical protein IWW57_001349 [Coemansia sp. S610]|nr:hypothetical protein IWW57_001349 [Coemansia sp. S610]
MTTRLAKEELDPAAGDVGETPAGTTAAKPDYGKLVGENIGFNFMPGVRDSSLNELVRRIMHRNCDAILKISTPCDPGCCTLASKIAENLEARLTAVALGKKGKNDPLDEWAMDVLAWAGVSAPAASVGDESEPAVWEASAIAPCLESLMLFVAHHINEHVTSSDASELLDLKDCRLILPIAKSSLEAECTNPSLEDYVDPVDFANFECGMFPIDSSVERQAAPALHLFVADVEVARDFDDRVRAEIMMAAKTKELFFNQHNRRFAWGLTASSCTIRAYVFGKDDIWASAKMDIASAEGRLTFISLLVDWSLCPVDRLGFDPSIRYVLNGDSGHPYLEIDVHKMNEGTGQVEKRTYYGQRCVGAADRLTGRHARYFAVSTDPQSMDKPAFLIKDVWAPSGSGSAGATHESSVLNILYAEFDRSSDLSSGFARLVSTRPVYIKLENALVKDTTITAFAGLPSTSRARQHRRTVMRWVGNTISAADDENQIVVAIADAMTALIAAHSKCKILHGNISDRAILFCETADRTKGVLAEFDYASVDGNSAGEVPELMIFRSILSLENARRRIYHLDDTESILYLVCWLGTFGINRKERMEYAVDYAARCAAGRKPCLPILSWNQGTVAQSAQHKRNHMDTAKDFEVNILSNMRHGPLRKLAKDLHQALFLHPGCSGAKKTAY